MELLKEYDGSLQVFMSADPEGNSYSALACLELTYKDPEDNPIHRSDYPEWDLEELSQAIVLWP